MDPDSAVDGELGTGKLVKLLPREPLKPVSDRGEVVLFDPSPLVEDVPDVKVGALEDKVVRVIVLLS